MKVLLLAHTPDPERICCAAAKLTHEPEEKDFVEMMDGMSRGHMERVLGYVLMQQHESVVEHASFTFYVEGVSRALTHQLVRHRVASYSQQSQRYVRLENFSYIVPPKLEGGGRERFEKTMERLAEDYDELLELVPPEDARYLLPNACTTKIVITMNARELRHFFKLRLHKAAQWEIREMAKRMYDLCMDTAPLLFKGVEMYEAEEGTRKTGADVEGTGAGVDNTGSNVEEE
ncbi:MAG: FAD-dependent thymidylate synthase [Thermoplasmata archaeon]|nr:FAD-dependent thymidylate synthase [Thermoplasmata archaeon]